MLSTPGEGDLIYEEWYVEEEYDEDDLDDEQYDSNNNMGVDIIHEVESGRENDSPGDSSKDKNGNGS